MAVKSTEATRPRLRSAALDQYDAYLSRRLAERSPKLLERNTWDRDFLIDSIGKTLPAPKKTIRSRGTTEAERFPPYEFVGPTLLRNELKLYFVEALFDPRHESYKWWYDRRPLFSFLANSGHQVLEHFQTRCLADIPGPLRPADHMDYLRGGFKHNPELVLLYCDWWQRHMNRRVEQTQSWISGGQVVEARFPDGPLAMIGDVHRWLVIAQEQMRPLEQRNIIVLRELFSEEQTRLNERQKRHDAIINFYKFPRWMRPTVRRFLLDKILHDGCAPATVSAMLATLGYFRDFMHERFESPSPQELTRALIEDDFIAWGKARPLRGYNWFHDTVALLSSAARNSPDEWPVLNVDKRAVRKLGRDRTTRTRSDLFERRVGTAAERAMPARVADTIAEHVNELPHSHRLLFLMALAIGARAEDLHALLYDAIRPDPHDDRFVVLHFWQNKVSRWNTKPLLKSDPLHKQLIEAVEMQKAAIVQTQGAPTKYLFPVFNGKVEGFLEPPATSQVFRRLCLRHDIRTEGGEVYRFTWHALRHYRGTQVALQGSDILAIMLELGHVSPDMAMTYVNRRLDLKKKTLLEKGGGRFFTIEGAVDEHVTELLVKKDVLVATHVAGGACTLPYQLGEWCDHAHACLSCKHFRADGGAVEHFESEKLAIEALVKRQNDDLNAVSSAGRSRTSEVIQLRIQRNRAALVGVTNVLAAIRSDGEYTGTESHFRRPPS